MAPRQLGAVSLANAVHKTKQRPRTLATQKRPRRSQRLRVAQKPPHMSPPATPSPTATIDPPSSTPSTPPLRSASPCSSLSPTVPPSTERLEDVVVRNVLTSPTAVNPRFLHSARARNIDGDVREVVVDWLMEVAAEYDARPQTLALAVNYMDRVLDRLPVHRESIQLLAVVCMLIACKIEETDPPSVADIMFICDNSYDKHMVHHMENRVLAALDFRLTYPTHFSVVAYIAKTMRSTSGRLTQVAEFAAHVALMDAQLATESVGVVAMACILVAMKIQGLDASCLHDCADSVLEHCGKEAGDAALRVIECWCKLARLHHSDQSRWVFIRWPKVAGMLSAVADDRLASRKRKDVCGTLIEQT